MESLRFSVFAITLLTKMERYIMTKTALEDMITTILEVLIDTFLK